ncbi:MAG: PAS domain-containing protein [Alphaproteobacteria bacterium]|nr:PAS domain-containing protein [Alphaproteobacteria bacterium]
MNDSTNSARSQRSANSVAFEAFWRSLPRHGAAAPNRREFKPEKAARFLRNLVLVEGPRNADARLRIRLVGSAMQMRIQRDITGADYLDFLAPEHQDAAVQTGLVMLTRPCGLWQCMDVHYERGFAQRLELTAFPLLADAESLPLILCFVEPTKGLVTPTPHQGRAMWADTAAQFEFIDTGAGLPAWPQAA